MNYNKIFSDFKNLKILITGTTGFKGAWLAYWLNLLGAKVIGLGLKPEKNFILVKKLKLNKSVKQYIFDISDYEKLSRLIKYEKPDFIFHLAAQSIVSEGYNNPLKTFKSNIIGSANILEVFRKFKSLGLVYVTSDKCYFNTNTRISFDENDKLGGFDNYSASKACAEHIFFSYYQSYFLNNSEKKIVSVRAGNVIGGGDFKKDRIIPDIIRSIQKNKKIEIRNPNSVRPWQHVLEPLSGYLLLAHKMINNKIKDSWLPIWNFGPQKNNSKKVIYIAKKILGYFNKINLIKIENKKKFKESKYLSININKAAKELNWKPKLSLEQSLDLTCDWYKSLIAEDDLNIKTTEQINNFSDK
jgi:CDP-glucose 4,6-dehydratase